MRKARLFKNGEPVLVEADQVLAGEYSRYEDFVDPEYEFRVTFVKDSKGHGGPYFRLYLSREDYNALTPERKTRYDILCEQRHYAESKWHREWEEKCSPFCKKEYYVRGQDKSYKRADCYCEKSKTAIEFQHSFIAHDFEERCEFYTSLGLNIVWLYDLTMMTVVPKEDGFFEILENNAKGFFRIAEDPANLADYPVFIQVRGGKIYRVAELQRKEIEGDKKSTVRFFKPVSAWDEKSFLDGLESLGEDFRSRAYIESTEPKGKTIAELWDPSYSQMIVRDLVQNKEIVIFASKNGDGDMMREYGEAWLRVAYVTYDEKTGRWSYNSHGNFYSLGKFQQEERKWALLKAVSKTK